MFLKQIVWSTILYTMSTRVQVRLKTESMNNIQFLSARKNIHLEDPYLASYILSLIVKRYTAIKILGILSILEPLSTKQIK